MLAKLELRDDRGQPLTQLGQFDLRDGLWHDHQRPWHAAVWPVATNAAVMLYLAWMTWRGNWTTPSAWQTVLFVVFLVGIVWASRRPTSSMRRRVWGPIAWLCAYRVCGACGYGLGAIEPEADGIAVCPECGAAWHRDRWTMEGLDARESKDLLKLIEGNPFGKMGTSAIDDRGVPIEPAQGFYPRWVRGFSVPAEVRKEVRDQLRQVGAGRVVVFNAIALPLWAGAIALMMLSNAPLPRDWWGMLVLFTLVTGLLYVLLLYLAVKSAVSSGRIRATALEVGRCPNCGETLGSGRVEFDGCEVCSKCRRAWKHAKVGRVGIAKASLGEAS